MSIKINNFQEEFSIHDIEVAKDVKATYNCGMSRIVLKAPNQIYRIYKSFMKEPDCAVGLIQATTALFKGLGEISQSRNKISARFCLQILTFGMILHLRINLVL